MSGLQRRRILTARTSLICGPHRNFRLHVFKWVGYTPTTLGFMLDTVWTLLTWQPKLA